MAQLRDNLPSMASNPYSQTLSRSPPTLPPATLCQPRRIPGRKRHHIFHPPTDLAAMGLRQRSLPRANWAVQSHSNQAAVASPQEWWKSWRWQPREGIRRCGKGRDSRGRMHLFAAQQTQRAMARVLPHRSRRLPQEARRSRQPTGWGVLVVWWGSRRAETRQRRLYPWRTQLHRTEGHQGADSLLNPRGTPGRAVGVGPRLQWMLPQGSSPIPQTSWPQPCRRGQLTLQSREVRRAVRKCRRHSLQRHVQHWQGKGRNRPHLSLWRQRWWMPLRCNLGLCELGKLT